MSKTKGLKNEIAGKTKRLAGEILGDHNLYDAGKEQERQGKEERNEPNEIKPFGNIDQLT
ncbi:MAG TPA: CsbD family protein [Bradyrhizobium sp.]|nr:CsbD family protein [Bradyrhizobium sp.]